MIYSLPYITFLLMIFVFFLFKKHIQISLLYATNRKVSIKMERIFFILTATVFLGLRGYIEEDWVIYYPYFKGLPSTADGFAHVWEATIGSFFEPGYTLFNVIIKSIYDNYLFLQFLCSVITLIVLNNFFEKYVDDCYFLAWIFFFCFYGFVIEIITLRTAIAMMCFLVSIRYIEERNFFKYLAWNLLGVSFHIGAVIYIPMYFMVRIRYKNATYMLFFILGLLIFIFRISVIRTVFDVLAIFLNSFKRFNYLYENRIAIVDQIAPLGYSIGFFERIFTFFVVFRSLDKIVGADERMIIFWNIMFLYFCTFFFCWDVYALNERIPVMLSCSYWILYPKIYKNLSLGNKLFFAIVLLLYCILKTDLLLGDKKAYYENILFGISNMDMRRIYYSR